MPANTFAHLFNKYMQSSYYEPELCSSAFWRYRDELGNVWSLLLVSRKQKSC